MQVLNEISVGNLLVLAFVIGGFVGLAFSLRRDTLRYIKTDFYAEQRLRDAQLAEIVAKNASEAASKLADAYEKAAEAMTRRVTLLEDASMRMTERMDRVSSALERIAEDGVRLVQAPPNT